MRKLFFPRALLPDGWAEDVTVAADASGRITGVTAGAPCPADAERQEGAAIPGVPNLHSHAHQRAIAGLGERSGQGAADSFWSWRDAMYTAVGRMEPDDFQVVATRAYIEMLKAGFTRVGEFHYLHHAPGGTPYDDPAEMSHRAVAAARAAGIGMTLLPVLYTTAGFDRAPLSEGQSRFGHDGAGFLKLMERLDKAYADAVDVDLGIAPHSLRAVPPDLLAEVTAARPDGPIHIHIAEQTAEVQDCIHHTGRRPVQWLLENAAPDERWCLIHATHVDHDEVVGMAEARAVVGLCPTTEANLGDGIFPAEDYLAANGRFGIGSDSHISISPVEDLRWLEYGQRLTTRRRTVLAGGPRASTGARLLRGALAGGAQAMGADIGALAEGARADIVVLDDAHPLLAARSGDALLDSWIFSGNATTVRHVIVGGRTVVEDGRHPLDEDSAARFTRVLERLFA
ncbi:Formiminoglutamic iminohydrolase [Caenispirillum salinarum AK4]|uniref:Formiminoglutamic iminohydrolase n=1 Tax=Caenispirillum salinarum AK4 TaxID=1238182 RepID=K9HR90_9PROT|nr:formimidoylglutamate deiminase [Caenispirillum salinarum]EKV32798.1 Formiminoglutamic iminohydrolase [Caenispirillum salinarum AK4]